MYIHKLFYTIIFSLIFANIVSASSESIEWKEQSLLYQSFSKISIADKRSEITTLFDTASDHVVQANTLAKSLIEDTRFEDEENFSESKALIKWNKLTSCPGKRACNIAHRYKLAANDYSRAANLCSKLQDFIEAAAAYKESNFYYTQAQKAILIAQDMFKILKKSPEETAMDSVAQEFAILAVEASKLQELEEQKM